MILPSYEEKRLSVFGVRGLHLVRLNRCASMIAILRICQLRIHVEKMLSEWRKEIETHALLALAAKNALSIWKSDNCIWPIITEGE